MFTVNVPFSQKVFGECRRLQDANDLLLCLNGRYDYDCFDQTVAFHKPLSIIRVEHIDGPESLSWPENASEDRRMKSMNLDSVTFIYFVPALPYMSSPSRTTKAFLCWSQPHSRQLFNAAILLILPPIVHPERHFRDPIGIARDPLVTIPLSQGSSPDPNQVQHRLRDAQQSA
jgi:hypothetical protein